MDEPQAHATTDTNHNARPLPTTKSQQPVGADWFLCLKRNAGDSLRVTRAHVVELHDLRRCPRTEYGVRGPCGGEACIDHPCERLDLCASQVRLQ